jgi:hypothetical protein
MLCSVVDLDSLNQYPDTDPDLAFSVNPGPDPIRIQGSDDQKLKGKKMQLFIFFDQS